MKKAEEEKKVLYEYLLEKSNQDKFYRLAFSYVRNQEAALDVVQDAVVNALKGYSNLREKTYLKTWFYRILVHCAVNYIRKDTKYCLTEEIPEEEADWKQNTEMTEKKMDLYDAVEALPENLKTIVIMRFFEDMKLSEIASILQTPESTVKTRLRSALDKLSTALKEEYHGRKIAGI